MGEKICTISIGNGWLDDDYTFYKDGRIEHYYDQHPTKHSITDWINAENLNENRKNKILEKCSEACKSQVEEILGVS